MPGKCPKCGGRILKKTSRNGYVYYGCERNGDKLGRACDFMTWDVPVKETCPMCGQNLFKKSGRGFKKPFCINEECAAFVPEEKRGGYKKKTEGGEKSAGKDGGTQTAEAGEDGVKKTATKKATATKAVGSRGAEKKAKETKVVKKAPAKKTAAKKATAAKATSSKGAEKKAPAKKITGKAAVKKTKEKTPAEEEA
jgi:DNA topoisomerase-1